MNKLYSALPLYIGAEVMLKGGDKRQVLTPRLMCAILENNTEVQLILRPLSSMLADEALELAKLTDPHIFGDYRYSKWEAEIEIITSGRNKEFKSYYYNVKNKKDENRWCIDLQCGIIYLYNREENETTSVSNNIYWQWYIQNKFDVPLLPDNKTLIESGHAIDISTLK